MHFNALTPVEAACTWLAPRRTGRLSSTRWKKGSSRRRGCGHRLGDHAHAPSGRWPVVLRVDDGLRNVSVRAALGTSDSASPRMACAVASSTGTHAGLGTDQLADLHAEQHRPCAAECLSETSRTTSDTLPSRTCRSTSTGSSVTVTRSPTLLEILRNRWHCRGRPPHQHVSHAARRSVSGASLPPSRAPLASASRARAGSSFGLSCTAVLANVEHQALFDRRRSPRSGARGSWSATMTGRSGRNPLRVISRSTS